MEMPPYLPITSDYGFKVTFGNPGSTLFLRRALQALIQSETPIREVTFEPTTFEGLTAERRGGVLDLNCVDEQGRHFIVEMQVAYSPQFLQRLKFYALHKLESLVQRGPFSWATLPPIYCVALLSRSILPGPDYHTIANLRKASGELVDEQLTFVLLELDKLELPPTAPRTDLEKLIFTMQNIHKEPRDAASEPAFWQEPWLRQALDQLSTRNMTRAQYDEYLFLQMQRMDELTAEEERQKNIAARQQAETERQQAEQAKVQAEQAKVQAEQAKVQAEQAKVQAEQATAQAEQATAQAEQATAQAEQATAQAEQATAQAEQAKVQAEQATAQAEQAAQNHSAQLPPNRAFHGGGSGGFQRHYPGAGAALAAGVALRGSLPPTAHCHELC